MRNYWVQISLAGMLLLILGGMLLEARPAKAFELSTNYWLTETLTVGNVDLPVGVKLRTSDPTLQSRPYLILENQTETLLFVLSLNYKDGLVMESADPNWKSRLNTAHDVASFLVTPNRPAYLGIEALTDLDQNLVDRNVLNFEPPAGNLTIPNSQSSELLLVYGGQVIIVPYMLGYTLNPGFENGAETYLQWMANTQATDNASSTATQQMELTLAREERHSSEARRVLDEGAGTVVTGSPGTVINGSSYPTSRAATGWNWNGIVPFNDSLRPGTPTLVQPLDGAIGVDLQPADPPAPTNHVDMEVSVFDEDSTSLSVTFYGRPACATPPNFTVVALPDTQYYTSQTNNGSRAMFDAQTTWIVNNASTRNIVYVTHLGDIVDNYSDTAQWDIAGKLTPLEGALTALDRTHIKYGLAIGNHDGAPNDTANFNSYFPSTRVGDGHQGSDNDNNYGLFSFGGMDFIVIHIEYGADATTRSWANTQLQTYSTRRAIVVTHNLLSGITSPASFSTEGQALYDALKDNANLFLMLGGHQNPEVSRTDTYNGHTVYSLRSDYQFRNGGDGWLRVIEFQPEANQIQVYTYSPYLDQWEIDADSQFTLPYAMGGTDCGPWQSIATNTNVASGSNTTTFWGPLDYDSQYQWYATVSDGDYKTNSPVWTFTTETTPNTPISVSISGSVSGLLGIEYPYTATVSPINATLPITYTWQSTGQSIITHTNGLTDAMNYNWDIAGMQYITVTVTNSVSTATDVFTVTMYNPAQANFSGTPISGITPLGVAFTNLSTGDYATCSWDFGDSGTSSACNDPGHIYTNPGAYTVTLTVSGSGGTNTETKASYITVYAPAGADFSGTPRSGIAPLVVGFTNLSGGVYDTCSWDFGDSHTSSDCNDPNYVFDVAGVYTVTLTVSGSGGTDTETKDSYIAVYAPAISDFSGTPTSGAAPLTVAFINLSSGDYATCSWAFGDGGTSSDCNNPSHIYDISDVYMVTLMVSGSGGTDTETKDSYIAVYAPAISDFSGTPTSGAAPLTVAFTNLSTGDYATCSWAFGDGGTSSDCNNPSHNYTNPGAYTVALTVSGSGGTDTETKDSYIAVYAPAISDFSGTPTSGAAPLTVAFTNLSTGDYATCSWDFGDSGTSTDCNDPSHIYDISDVYTVTLTVSGSGGTDTETKDSYITVYVPAVAAFSGTPTSGAAPLTVAFTNLSSGDYATCSWAFGDGGTSTDCNDPSYLYSISGFYTVTLTVSGLGGTDTETKIDYINVRSGETIRTYLPIIVKSLDNQDSIKIGSSIDTINLISEAKSKNDTPIAYIMLFVLNTLSFLERRKF